MLPMLERENLLMQLHWAAGAARSGSGKIIILEGEAGSGKTRLANEFLGSLSGDFLAGAGYCERPAAAHPLSALHDIIGQLGGDFRAAITGALAPFAALVDAIRASERCVVLLFEDAHWADNETLDLLRFVGRRIDTLRALVIVTYRDDETGPDHPLALALGDCPASCSTHLSLPPLSHQAVSELAELRGLQGEDIFTLSSGNPFLVVELLRHEPSRGQATELPASVRQAIAARLAPLDASARTWIDLLCVFPDGLDRDGLRLLGNAHQLDPADLPGWSGLLRVGPDGSIRFRHEAVRRVVRAALPSDRRRKIKADALAALSAEPRFVNQHNALLGDLAGRAELPAVAISFARQGARQAIAANRYREAARLLEQVLPLAAALDARVHAQLVMDWAELAMATIGLNDEGVSMLRRSGAIWRQFNCEPELMHYRILMSRVSRELGLFDPNPAESATAREAAMQSGNASLRSQALVLAAHERLDAGDLAKGRDYALAATHAARDAGDKIARLSGWLALAQARHRLGLACGARMAQACSRIAERDGLAMLSSATTACLFDETFAARDLVTADACLGDEPHRLVPASWQGGMAGRLALLRVVQGRFSEGESLADDVLRDNSVRPGMRYHAALAMALGRMRRLGRGAGDWLAEAEKLVGATASCRDVTQIKTAAIELAFLSGDYAQAREHCAAATLSSNAPVGAVLHEEVEIWRARLAHAEATDARSLACDPPEHAAALKQRGMPFEAALSELMASTDDAGTSFGRAILEFEAIGADAGIALARRLASKYAIEVQLPRRKRGPYRGARQHLLGLTRREVEILRMMVEGHGNREIANKLGRSLRTVEHHVSAILGKMGIENRIQAVIHAVARPEILSSSDDQS